MRGIVPYVNSTTHFPVEADPIYLQVRHNSNIQLAPESVLYNVLPSQLDFGNDCWSTIDLHTIVHTNDSTDEPQQMSRIAEAIAAAVPDSISNTTVMEYCAFWTSLQTLDSGLQVVLRNSALECRWHADLADAMFNGTTYCDRTENRYSLSFLWNRRFTFFPINQDLLGHILMPPYRKMGNMTLTVMAERIQSDMASWKNRIDMLKPALANRCADLQMDGFPEIFSVGALVAYVGIAFLTIVIPIFIIVQLYMQSTNGWRPGRARNTVDHSISMIEKSLKAHAESLAVSYAVALVASYTSCVWSRSIIERTGLALAVRFLSSAASIVVGVYAFTGDSLFEQHPFRPIFLLLAFGVVEDVTWSSILWQSDQRELEQHLGKFTDYVCIIGNTMLLDFRDNAVFLGLAAFWAIIIAVCMSVIAHWAGKKASSLNGHGTSIVTSCKRALLRCLEVVALTMGILEFACWILLSLVSMCYLLYAFSISYQWVRNMTGSTFKGGDFSLGALGTAATGLVPLCLVVRAIINESKQRVNIWAHSGRNQPYRDVEEGRQLSTEEHVAGDAAQEGEGGTSDPEDDFPQAHIRPYQGT